jgi:hypothetical protein
MTERLARDVRANDQVNERKTDKDAEGQRLAENEQEQPRTIVQKVANAVEDMIPGDSDNDSH